jgi:transposase
MDPISAQETSERDQLWASLRALRPEIDRLAGGEFDGSDRQKQLVMVLARIVAAEMAFRAREAGAE